MGDLVDIIKIDPTIQINCVYATTHNFTGQKIYAQSNCRLLRPVAEQLRLIQQTLKKKGLGLYIWDAYRPLSAQKKLWEVCSNARYVSPPEKGGRHTRGTAVDLTIIQLSDGSFVDMGTRYDDFTEKAHYASLQVSEEAKKNRKKLRDIMQAYGFEPYDNEWWHFDYSGWTSYPVLAVE